jgi:hypothetical protein
MEIQSDMNLNPCKHKLKNVPSVVSPRGTLLLLTYFSYNALLFKRKRVGWAHGYLVNKYDKCFGICIQ